eukprot:237575-Pleurochrysis_carterae.AAC.1
MADHALIWLMPCMRDALRDTGAGTVTFAQCALGAKARRPSRRSSGACERRGASTGRARTR